MRLVVRGNAIMIAAGLLVVPLAFESKLGSAEALYSGLLLGLILFGLVVGFCVIIAGSQKQKRELSRGYTPKVSVASAHPELFLIDYKTLAVVARPNEARPSRAK